MVDSIVPFDLLARKFCHPLLTLQGHMLDPMEYFFQLPPEGRQETSFEQCSISLLSFPPLSFKAIRLSGRPSSG